MHGLPNSLLSVYSLRQYVSHLFDFAKEFGTPNFKKVPPIRTGTPAVCNKLVPIWLEVGILS